MYCSLEASPSLISSWTLTLSITSSSNPALFTSCFNFINRSKGQTSPAGRSIRDVTTPVIPGICLIYFNGMGSIEEPYHLKVIFIYRFHPFWQTEKKLMHCNTRYHKPSFPKHPYPPDSIPFLPTGPADRRESF